MNKMAASFLRIILIIFQGYYVYDISGPCSVVGIATYYGLDDPGIESR